MIGTKINVESKLAVEISEDFLTDFSNKMLNDSRIKEIYENCNLADLIFKISGGISMGLLSILTLKEGVTFEEVFKEYFDVLNAALITFLEKKRQ